MKFFDREKEIASLQRAFESVEAGLYVMYGRRRLGKTTLLQRFSADIPTVYHVADRMTERDAIRMMAQSMAIALDEPLMAEPEYPDWYALFGTFDRFRSHNQKVCLIFDEYQYLCEIQPAFSSILQKWWDQHWSKQNLLVILCGSVLSMMYKETLAHSSPLYGRRTGQCLLSPLTFADTRPFFGKATTDESLRLWALTGGVPRYAELAGRFDTLENALKSCVMEKDGPLFAEATFLLQEEVNNPNVYWSLLRAIANGANRISEIAAKMKMQATQLSPYISALRDMNLIERVTPITESNPAKSKRGIYCMTDNFLRLWFHCLAPYESLLEMGRIDAVMKRISAPLQNHIAWAYEKAVREYLVAHSDQLDLFHVGRYWDKNCEFDAVGINESFEPVLIAEAKWSTNPLDMNTVEDRCKRTRSCWPNQADNLRYAFFSRSGFTNEVHSWAETNNGLLIDVEALIK